MWQHSIQGLIVLLGMRGQGVGFAGAVATVGLEFLQAPGAKHKDKRPKVTPGDDLHPGQAFSEDGSASVWPAKGSLDLQVHLAGVPDSCWTISWQDPAGAVSCLLKLSQQAVLCTDHLCMQAHQAPARPCYAS